MTNGLARPAGRREFAVAALVFVLTLTIRAWGITTRFQLLGDQIRDWDIALRPLTDLPLVGPPTHVHGYTIGPAFYWILWAIRVAVGPWFQNLPHAGGIGQAVLQSAADALLLLALRRRIGSMWVALAVVIVEATAPFDVSLAAVVWNPTMGSMLAKVATALVLLDWHRGSTSRAATLFGVAWMAVHAYTGAVFVTVAVFATAVIDPLFRRERSVVIRNVTAMAAIVAALQVPYVVYQLTHRGESAMAAVTGSVGEVLGGRAELRVSASVAGYLKAVNGIEIAPWQFPFTGWVLLAAALVVTIRYWRDRPILLMTVLPQALAILGYAFFLSGLDNYYYLSLMPAAVMTVMLAVTAVVPMRIARIVAAVVLIGTLAAIPTRRNYAMTLHQMPEYGAIVHASRVIVGRGMPVRAIEIAFPLPPTNNPEYLYRILGGQIDRASPWVAIIERNGDVTYRRVSTA